MSRKYPGLYLYYDWLKNLERLPRGVAMEIVLNLYHYAKDRRAPEPLSDPGYEIVLDMLMDQVKRSIGMSENVRQGIEQAKRASTPPVQSIQGMSDEEVLEYFRTHEEYADEDPRELLQLQRLISGERKPRMQSNEPQRYNLG